MSDSIAIVGMAGRFPGARSVAEFWSNIRNGTESLGTSNAEDLRAAGVSDRTSANPRFVPVHGAVDADMVEMFDYRFFGYSRTEAEQIDPQQRVFLECAWEAVEDAGYDTARDGASVGVFAGCGINTYLPRHLGVDASGDAAEDFGRALSSEKDFLATRAAYKLDLRGPAFTVQSACSTSLVAVHLACRSLLERECDVALAGGVTIRLPQKSGYLWQDGMILSPDGHTRSFAADANGVVFGNGCGVVALRRLEDAMADGDRIYAVILATAVNNDGAAKVGYTAPSVDGQAEVIALAQALADVDARSIRYVETHGTATPVGDAIEIAALTQLFGEQNASTHPVYIGSVKSNVGHLDCAAGAAGLIKAALAVCDGIIPASLHGDPAAATLTNTPFLVPHTTMQWPALERRIAGVSSFGIGGTNAHAIVAQPPRLPAAYASQPSDAQGPHILAFSARAPQALTAMARSYRELIDRAESDTAVRAICAAAAQRRRALPYRAAMTASDSRALAEQLTRHADALATTVPAVSQERNRVAFVFPGQGSQWVGMGRDLLDHEPAFAATIDQCAVAFAPYIQWDLRAVLRGDSADDTIVSRIDVIQPALFAMQVGLAGLWQEKGFTPAAVVGHSMGEVAAAYVAGILSLEDAARIICTRSALLLRISGQGAMLVADLTPLQAETEIAPYAGRVSVAVINSHTSTVLSGEPAAIAEIHAKLQAANIPAALVKADVASHGPSVDSIRTDLLAALETVRPRQQVIPMHSTVGSHTAVTGDAAYWWANLRQPVMFADRIRDLAGDGIDAFIEMSAHPTLIMPVEDVVRASDAPAMAVPSMRRGHSARETMLDAVGRMFAAGHRIPWDRVFGRAASHVALPSYPWQREPCWVPLRDAQDARAIPRAPDAPRPRPDDADRNVAGSGTEHVVRTIWTEMLGTPRIDVNDSFFALGGHSLLAIRMLNRVRAETDIAIPLPAFLADPTIAGITRHVDEGGAITRHGATTNPWSLLVPLQTRGALPPIFCTPPIMGTAFPYARLAAALGSERPFFGLQPPGMNGGATGYRTVQALAATFADAIRLTQPHGPYHIVGWSFGAPVAFELARTLKAGGDDIALLALIDTPAPVTSQMPSPFAALAFVARDIMPKLMPYAREYITTTAAQDEHAPGMIARLRSLGLPSLARVYGANAIANARYRALPYDGPVTLLRTSRRNADATWGWGEVATHVDIRDIPGEHMTLLAHPHVAHVAAVLADCIDTTSRGNSHATESAVAYA